MTRTIALFLVLLFPASLYAIVPPAHNRVMPAHLKAQAEALRKEYAEGYWYKRAEERRLAREQQVIGAELTPAVLSTDTAYVPVLLGRYSDAQERFSPQAFQDLLFDGPNPSGTVTQFYLDNSYGQLYFTGQVEGWFAAPRGFDYYVHDGGSRNAGLEYGGKDFTIDVLAIADQTTDFSKYIKYYDPQQRGHVPQLGIVHTGGDAAAGASNIWSHRSNIRGRLRDRKTAGPDPFFDVNRVTSEGWYLTNDLTPAGNAVLVDGDYAIEPELIGNSNNGTALIKIGVFAHEFGHIFGLPDLYDTDNSSEGLGNWCVMAAGSYGADGAHEDYPSNFSAWCKERMGWVTPIVVTSYAKGQAIHNVEDFPEIFKIWKLGVPAQEYFLIENRQRVKSDKYLLNTGLLIYHVDNSRTNNTDENHYLVDLRQADGNRDLNRNANRGDAGDPFPGSTNNHTFDGNTNPKSSDYSNAATYVGARNISSSDLTMTADLDVGTRPYVALNSAAVLEGTGTNNNGRVEPGEEGNLQLQLANLYPTAGSNLQLLVRSSAQGATVDTSMTFSIEPLSEITITLQRFLHVAPSFTPREVSFDIEIGSPQDTLRYVDTIVLGFPRILLVDRDSTGENIVQYYRTAVDRFGAHHESFRTQGTSFSAASIDKRTTVVWLTGRKKTDTVPDSAFTALTSFVNTGGNLFITGQNIAEDLQAKGSSFLSQVLHAQWSKNIAVGRTVFGDPADALGAQVPKLIISGGNGASNQTSPDELTPDTLAHKALLYNSLTGSSIAGVWYEHPVSHGKIVFLGFGFEAINDSSTGVSRQQVMNAVLTWFNEVTSAATEEFAGTIPGSFVLHQNYPNPFNPATQINYALSNEAGVTLTVFNVLGQEVTRLVDEVQRPGNYSVQWNATNAAGTHVGSGIYFYRLEADSKTTSQAGQHFVSIKKMVLLK